MSNKWGAVHAGIGAIMDFVPVHFAVDFYGLKEYDGTALYEYPHGDVGTSEWGSCNFIHSRGEVRSFLQSAANYWLKEFHFDGLRMDAVSRLIYWQGDEKREPDWDLLKMPAHDSFHCYIRELNSMYLKKKAIWTLDHTYDGFKWVDCKSDNKCVFGYTRTDGKQTLLALFNFSDKEAAIAPEFDGKVSMLLNTDWEQFGGYTVKSLKRSLPQTISPFTGLLFTYQKSSVSE